MPRTMRTAIVKGLRQPVRIEEVPIPAPGPGKVLVKIVASGVCHTDLPGTVDGRMVLDMGLSAASPAQRASTTAV